MRSEEYKKNQTNAIVLVKKAVKSGVLPHLKKTKVKCVDCGKRATDYDHRDYTQPLRVNPVCHSCNIGRGPAMGFYNRKEKEWVACSAELVEKLKNQVKKATKTITLAEKLGWGYQRLTHKLGGFSPMRQEEAEQIILALEKIQSES